MKITVVDYNKAIPIGDTARSWKQRFWTHVVKGLQNIGHEIEFIAMESMSPNELPTDADGYIFWNGQKGNRYLCRLFIEKMGKVAICVERGWIKRMEHYHFSSSGSFGPFAHFHKELGTKKVTSAMNKRMAKLVGVNYDLIGTREASKTIKTITDENRELWTNEPAPQPKHKPEEIPNFKKMKKAELVEYINKVNSVMTLRFLKPKLKDQLISMAQAHWEKQHPNREEQIQPSDGNVLLIHQVAGDAQVHGEYEYSPVNWTNEILKALDEVGNNRKVIVRTHPMGHTIEEHAYTIPDSQAGLVEVHGGKAVSLADDFAEAKYMIGYNSNSFNEAVIIGLPCITCGNHLMNNAEGVCQQASMDRPDIIDAIINIEDNWNPEPQVIRDYLSRLCSFQLTLEEISTGDCLKVFFK